MKDQNTRDQPRDQQITRDQASDLKVTRDQRVTGRGQESGDLEHVPRGLEHVPRGLEHVPPRASFRRGRVPVAISSNDDNTAEGNINSEANSIQAPTRNAVARLLDHNNQVEAVTKVNIFCCSEKRFEKG